MDTNLIYQFRTVFESGTVAKAAESLNMTPGALSRALKRLEVELDTQLFTPSGRNILPTTKAEKFYHASTNIIHSIEQAKKQLKQNNLITKEVKISTFEVFSTHFIAWLVDHGGFNFHLTLQEATPSFIEKNILSGLSDIGITYIPELHPELDHLHVADMHLGVFRSKNSKNIKDLPFAIPITELGINHLQAKSLDGWPTDLPRDVKYKFEMLETALDLASRGYCKLLCPKFIIEIENERLSDKYKLLEDPQVFKLPKFKVYLVKMKNSSENEEFKKIAKALRLILK